MILALLLACGGAPEGPDATPGVVPAPATDVTPCDPAVVPEDIGRIVPLRVYVDRSVPAERVDTLVAGAVDFWGTWGVELQVAVPVVVDLPAPLGGSRAELDAALQARGIDPGGAVDPADRALLVEAVGSVVLAPLKAHLEARAIPVQEGVDVLIVPAIAAAASPVDQAFARLDGLTFRADLAQRTDAMGTLVQQLQLAQFTPTVMIGLAGVDARSPGGWEGTLTHELGHALGLEHVTDAQNLMVEMPPRCVPALSPEQVAQLRGG